MSSTPRHAPPGAPPDRLRTPFKCPICRSQVFIHVGPSKNGRDVFECAGCTVLFRDPERFTRFEPYTSGIAAPDFRTNWRSVQSKDED